MKIKGRTEKSLLRFLFPWLCVFTFFGFYGCAVKKQFDPLPRTFLEDVDINQKIDNLPYDHAWVREGIDPKAAHAIFIKPVRTDLLPENSWKASRSILITSEEDYQAKAKELAEYHYCPTNFDENDHKHG